MIPVITVEGATASGKSSVSLKIATALNTDIISADSRQVYRYLDIGTAKPSRDEQQNVKHHLIDIVDPNQEYSAGKYATDCFSVIKSLREKNRLPLITGGTGFYIKSLFTGLFESPPIADNVRDNLDTLEANKGVKHLHLLLEEIDPVSAKRIHPNDSYRIKRALEVWIATGKSLSKHWEEQNNGKTVLLPFRILIYENRNTLYERINNRMESMIDQGLLSEIRNLLAEGYKTTDPGMNSVGYKEFYPHILGNVGFQPCLEEAKKNTRNYAKRQLTWYRKLHYDYYVRDNEFSVDKLFHLLKNFFAPSLYPIIFK